MSAPSSPGVHTIPAELWPINLFISSKRNPVFPLDVISVAILPIVRQPLDLMNLKSRRGATENERSILVGIVGAGLRRSEQLEAKELKIKISRPGPELGLSTARASIPEYTRCIRNYDRSQSQTLHGNNGIDVIRVDCTTAKLHRDSGTLKEFGKKKGSDDLRGMRPQNERIDAGNGVKKAVRDRKVLNLGRATYFKSGELLNGNIASNRRRIAGKSADGGDPDTDGGGDADALPNNDAGALTNDDADPRLSVRATYRHRRPPRQAHPPPPRALDSRSHWAAVSRCSHCSSSASSSSSSPSQSPPAAASSSSPFRAPPAAPAPATIQLPHTHRPARHTLRLLRHLEPKSPDPRAERLVRLAGTQPTRRCRCFEGEGAGERGERKSETRREGREGRKTKWRNDRTWMEDWGGGEREGKRGERGEEGGQGKVRGRVKRGKAAGRRWEGSAVNTTGGDDGPRRKRERRTEGGKESGGETGRKDAEWGGGVEEREEYGRSGEAGARWRGEQSGPERKCCARGSGVSRTSQSRERNTKDGRKAGKNAQAQY
ncbi:hypothetical protein C8J57DRAFT_1464183 [Mycena rebaudengoi]|nr:hypothetical protein C8J57DRAFT_1464183 [Mycena rebaudengoi]